MSTVHVVGAGLAGLSCAVALAGSGHRVIVHEAAGQAGGRCRSFHDRALDRVIDNGNHLILGGNDAVFRYLDRIGARDRLTGPSPAAFPFLDLKSGERWTLRPNAGRLPWWMLDRRRRVPGTASADYLAAARLLLCSSEDTVADCFDTGTLLFERLWGPVAIAALNVAPTLGSARLLRAVFVRTFLSGEAACRPFVAARALSDTFVDPALAFLERHGGEVRLRARLRGLEVGASRITALDLTDARVPLGADDKLVLAVPPPVVSELLPGQSVPTGATAIVNAHFRTDRPVRLPGGQVLLGLVGGTAEWLFARGDVVAVTVSAADRLVDEASEQLTALLWRDVATAIAEPGQPPPVLTAARIIKEKRATFAQTPAEVARRPPPRTRFANLLLAGDWTDTHLPATIEGAIRSGEQAAALVIGASGGRSRAASLRQASHGARSGLFDRA